MLALLDGLCAFAKDARVSGSSWRGLGWALGSIGGGGLSKPICSFWAMPYNIISCCMAVLMFRLGRLRRQHRATVSEGARRRNVRARAFAHRFFDLSYEKS